MKSKIIGLLAVAIALVPPVAFAEGRTGTEAIGLAPMTLLAPPTAFVVDAPSRTVVAPNGKEAVLFRAPYGVKVRLLDDKGNALWERDGAGANPVSVPLAGLAENEVHLLFLQAGDAPAVALPPIVVTAGSALDIGLVAKIGRAIGDASGWDFNGDKATGTAAEKAADLRALLHSVGPSPSLTLPSYTNALTSFSLKSGASAYAGTIDGNVVTVDLPFGTDLDSLSYEYQVSAGSTLEATEPTPDFTGSVAFRVVSPLGEERLYWVFANILPQFDLTAWTEPTESLWHVYDGSLFAKNQSVTKLVYLPDGDGSEGYLPVSPFSGKSLWYGKSTVTGSVYEVGNYLGGFDETYMPPEPDGGSSTSYHEGTIESPEFTVPNEGTPKLSFWSWWEIEGRNPDGFDLMNVRILKNEIEEDSLQLNPTSVDTGAINLPYTSAGYNQAAVWKRYEIDMTAFKGQTVRIALHFDTNDSSYNGFRGWFVDQFYLGDNEAPTIAAADIAGSTAVGSTLTAGYAGFADADNDAASTAKYVWWVSDDNGTSWKPLYVTTPTLTVDPLYQGKRLKVEIYPYDGKQYGNAASDTVDIPFLLY